MVWPGGQRRLKPHRLEELFRERERLETPQKVPSALPRKMARRRSMAWARATSSLPMAAPWRSARISFRASRSGAEAAAGSAAPDGCCCADDADDARMSAHAAAVRTSDPLRSVWIDSLDSSERSGAEAALAVAMIARFRWGV